MAYPGFITVKEMNMVKSADSQSFMESPWSALTLGPNPAFSAATVGEPRRKSRNLGRGLATLLGAGVGGISGASLAALALRDKKDPYYSSEQRAFIRSPWVVPLIAGSLATGGALGGLLGHHVGSIGDKRKQDNELVSRESLLKRLLGRGLIGSLAIPLGTGALGAVGGALGASGLAGLSGLSAADKRDMAIPGAIVGGALGTIGGSVLGGKYQRWLDSPEDKRIRSLLDRLYAKEDERAAPDRKETQARLKQVEDILRQRYNSL